MQWSSVAKDSAAASLGHFLPLSLLFSPLTSTMRWKSTCKWGVNISCPSTVTLSLIFSITELCFSNIAGLGAPAPVEGDCDLCVSIYSLIHSLNSQVNSQVLHLYQAAGCSGWFALALPRVPENRSCSGPGSFHQTPETVFLNRFPSSFIDWNSETKGFTVSTFG